VQARDPPCPRRSLQHDRRTRDHPMTATHTDHLRGSTPPVNGAHRSADALTGLAGRADLVAALRSALVSDRRAAVLFIDMDHFKRVNDTQGHQAGDDLLVDFANRLRGSVDVASTVARFGGDEFVVVIPDALQDEVQATIERILVSTSEPFQVRGRNVVVSASIGVAWSRDGATSASDADVLLQEADTALFEAKRLGRGRSQAFTADLRRRVVERVELEAALRDALERGQLRADYQPHVDLRTGRIVGIEALARWHRPDGTVVAPGTFIPIAEESGLILEIGRRMLDMACDQFAMWQRSVSSPPSMLSVNLSPFQLTDATLVDHLAATIRRTGIEPGSLCLELTESGFEGLTDEVDVLHDLRALGCFIGIDDFGTGYSSLQRLRDLPVEVLKIDQAFVAGLTDDSDDAAIVSAIMSLALTMGLHVIAEGVERPEQAAALTRLGCQVAQGYLFATPADAASTTSLLDRGKLWRPIVGDDAANDHGGVNVVATPRRGHRLFIHEFLDQIGVPMHGAGS
jgi:diguanylate cyclase (GGDEF)-like protein